MKKIITESAYHDESPDRPEYFVARYEYDSSEEMFQDKNYHHRGRGKTKEEAAYNLELQYSKNKNKKTKHSNAETLLKSIKWIIFFSAFFYLVARNFGTLASLEWLIISIFVCVFEYK